MRNVNYFGVMKAWQRKMAAIERQILKNQGKYEPYVFYKDKKEGLEIFSLEHLIGAFYTYFIMIGVSFLTFLAEYMYVSKIQKYANNIKADPQSI
jgi:hypothetical protein